jgi:hypothetical protein
MQTRPRVSVSKYLLLLCLLRRARETAPFVFSGTVEFLADPLVLPFKVDPFLPIEIV